MQRDPTRFKPVIVLAPARSLTSVVSTMIGQHPAMYGFPELILFAQPKLGAILQGDPTDTPEWRAYHQSGLVRAVAELMFDDQSQTSAERAREWLEKRANWSTIRLFDWLQAQVEPRAAVEKSPDTSGSDTAIFRAILNYPRARFVHLTRHPVTTIHSMMNHWRVLARARTTAPLELVCASLWYTSHLRILRITSEFVPDRTLRVQAEKIANSPKEELIGIAEWLGLATNTQSVTAMLHPERSPFAHFGPAGAPGGNDAKFLASPKPHRVDLPATLELPADWALDAHVRRQIEDLARKLGY